MSRQITIPTQALGELTFETYEAGNNHVLVDAIKTVAEGQRPGSGFYFWGESGTGKTHLLQACGVLAHKQGRVFHYLTCEVGEEETERLLETLTPGALVCLDDMHPAKYGELLEWKWLSMYDQLCQNEGNLIVAASRPPTELGLETRDLISRFTAGGVYHLMPLNEDGNREILMQRSRERGFDMPEPVIEYIMRNHARDTATLFSLLDRLDSASLAQHRRITVPFLKEFLR